MTKSDRSGMREDAIPYATFTARARALVIDAAVVGSGFLGLVILSPLVENVPGSGRFLLISILGLVFFYEPLMVWRRGATIGHQKANLRVVSDDGLGSPSLPRSFARFVLKTVLGLPSFVVMLFTRRHQALHDVLTRTTVQIRDVSVARSFDVVLERTQDAPAAMPSAFRRVLVVLVYWVVLVFIAGISLNLTIPEACLQANRCSAIEQGLAQVFSYGTLVAMIVLAAMGWRGRLVGARAREIGAPAI